MQKNHDLYHAEQVKVTARDVLGQYAHMIGKYLRSLLRKSPTLECIRWMACVKHLPCQAQGKGMQRSTGLGVMKYEYDASFL